MDFLGNAMVKTTIECGRIENYQGDALICSSNADLNLSGGVGGAMALKYGPEMQSELHGVAASRKNRLLQAGQFVITAGLNWPYQKIAHCVAVDVFYQTDQATVVNLYRTALKKLDVEGIETVISACLGCGYGRMDDELFAAIFQAVKVLQLKNIKQITFVSRDQNLVESLCQEG